MHNKMQPHLNSSLKIPCFVNNDNGLTFKPRYARTHARKAVISLSIVYNLDEHCDLYINLSLLKHYVGKFGEKFIFTSMYKYITIEIFKFYF